MTLDWPISLLPSQSRFALRPRTLTHESPLTGKTTTYPLPAATRWVADLTFLYLTNTEANALQGLLEALTGAAGRVRLFDPAHQRPRGIGRTATPGVSAWIHGTGQSANACRTEGWTPRDTVLHPGDLVQIGDGLHRVLADVTANASGAAVLELTPAFRRIPSDHTPIITTHPRALMRLVDDRQAEKLIWQGTGATCSGLQLVEVGL